MNDNLNRRLSREVEETIRGCLDKIKVAAVARALVATRFTSLQGRLRLCLSGLIHCLPIGILFFLLLQPVSVEARPVRVATFNIENGIGSIGSSEYNAVEDIVARMDADIVCFQELQTSSFAAWSNMASVLGYSYSAISGNGPFSGYLYNGFFSRFPIQSTANIESPPGAVELSRYPFRAVIEIPEAAAPLVIWNTHHKSGAAGIDKFRRSIEAYRIAQDVETYLTANPDHDEYVLVGDMNDDIRDYQTAQYYSQPTGAPLDYNLGSDIQFPVVYATFPNDRYISVGDGMLHVPSYWESTISPVTRVGSGRQLDYVFVSPALANSPLSEPLSETYYSAVDFGGGLPKWGDPLPAETSDIASDHLAIFVDIQMADSSTVVPVIDFVSSGEAGGPFSLVSLFYTVSETNVFDCTWSIFADADWLTVLPDSFILESLASIEVEVFLNSLIEDLLPGVYTASITFWNETEDVYKVRQVILTIRDPLRVGPADGLSSSGYVGGPFSPASKAYGVTNKGSQALTFTATSSASWLTVSPASWTLQAGSDVSVNCSLNSLADSLPIGTHSASVAFSNQTTGLIQSRPVVLRVLGTLCDAVDRCDLVWTTGGSVPWLYETNYTHDGVDAAQSGTISSSQQSWMETVVTGPIQVSYNWRVSSQTNTHVLRFLDNGLTLGQISGEIDWEQEILEIGSGVHTLRWEFVTASTTPQGVNAGWVDQISIDYLGLASTTSDWIASGWAGGPFTPSSQTYTLTNSGSIAIPWSVASDVDWVTENLSSGTLQPGGSTAIEYSLNANADALPSGTYSGTITFSNQITGFTFQRSVLLSGLGPLCDAVDRCDLVWTTDGVSDWFSQSDITHDGVDAAQSGEVQDNQSTWLETTVTGPLQLSFMWKADCSYADYLQFLVDGNWQAQQNGNHGWVPMTYTILEGEHTLRWGFINNSSVHYGANAGWVDQVSLDYLLATPSETWSPEGYTGGPFSPATQEYVLTNAGPSAIQWTAHTDADWISITPDSGIIDPGGFAIVECSLNSQSTTKTPGTHSSPITFSNQTTGSSLTRQASLKVFSYLIIYPGEAEYTGYVGGPCTPESQAFSIYNSGPATYDWIAIPSKNWVTIEPNIGTISPGATSNFFVSINANAYSLPVGLESASFLLRNAMTMVGQTCEINLEMQPALGVTVTGGTPSGPVGGPFDPAETVFTLSNRSQVTQDWSISPTTNWLLLSEGGGTLSPFSSIPITGTRNPEILTYPMGIYPTTVVFSNLTDQTMITHSPYLSVGFVFCEAVEGCGLTWTFGGNTSWLSQTNDTHDGIDAARSGIISAGQESWVYIRFSGAGTFSFWWKFSTQLSQDYFQIYMDGVGPRMSGTMSWREQSYTLEEGDHELRLTFWKRSTSTSGTDGGAWIDQISWTPERTALGVPVEWYQHYGLTPDVDDTWDALDTQPAANGYPNWQQYIAGLDPTGSNDTFCVHSIQQALGEPVQLEWWGGTNGPSSPYLVQSSTNVDFGPWTSAGWVPRVDGINTWSNTVTTDRMRYYRILAQPD